MTPVKRAKDEGTRYDFGCNWARFAETLDDSTIEQAVRNLDRLLPGLEGGSFLDIGCGSGLHSLAAVKLGASPVHAFDLDAVSVETTRMVLNRFAPGAEWDVEVKDMLASTPEQIGLFDTVYSWGVLHHTDRMWEAIDRAAKFVAPGGRLALALYLKTRFCRLWRLEKAFYSRHRGIRPLLLGLFGTANLARQSLGGKNPVAYVRNYKRKRGMSFWRDMDDWLGGYPYDSVEPAALVAFIEQRGFGLERSFDTAPPFGLFGSGCGEWVFRRGSSAR